MSNKERLENMSPIGFDLNGNVLLKGDDYHWLMERAEKAEKYREALKNIYELAEYDEYDNTLEQIVSEIEKALEG